MELIQNLKQQSSQSTNLIFLNRTAPKQGPEFASQLPRYY